MDIDMEVELHQIERILTEIIGRPSRWSGRMELTTDPKIKGAKPFRCDILLNESLAAQDVRWRTLIHEMLHTYLTGYNSPDYEIFRGWEEGVVEQLQRLLRSEVLSRLGITVDEAVFKLGDAHHDYNEFIAALEPLRQALKEDARSFYFGLLAFPLRDRSALVIHMGRKLVEQEYRTFIRRFAGSNAVLRTGR